MDPKTDPICIPKLTKADRQKRTIEVAKTVESMRQECAWIRQRLRENPHARLRDLYTERGLDGLTFEAVCYAFAATNTPIWPSQLADPGKAIDT